jgi:hypothetical protein
MSRYRNRTNAELIGYVLFALAMTTLGVLTTGVTFLQSFRI